MNIVVKIGGDLVKGGLTDELVDELVSINGEHSVLLVHGGGDVVTDIATTLGHPPRFVTSPKGFRSRYTDWETLGIFTMVMAGKINKEIVSKLQGRGLQAVGLCGLDGGIVKAQRKKQIIAVDERGRKMLLEGDYTGTIEKVDTSLIGLLLGNGYLPVISPLALGETGEPLNVDGDRLAAQVASALKVGRLVLLTDVEAVKINDKPVSAMHSYEVKEVLDLIGPGMITKLYAALEAVEGGVDEVIIASGLKEKPISSAINHENGTVIKR